jgi:hypothetical protein
MGERHPLAWCHDLPGGGSGFYTALGHTAPIQPPAGKPATSHPAPSESYAEPAFRAHLLGGIASVTGPSSV